MCLSPYFGALVSRGRCSLQVQNLPWGGGVTCFREAQKGHFSNEEKWLMEVWRPQKVQKGLDGSFLMWLSKKNADRSQAMVLHCGIQT